MKLGNIIANTFLRLTMCHVVGQIRQVWVKGSFNLKNGATSVILDKNNTKYNFYVSFEGSSSCKHIGQMWSKGQSRWADNDKECKMRKHISIRVNSRIPVQIIIIINYYNQSNRQSRKVVS